MLRVWKWYQNCLAVHPVKTQVISSGLIWGLGDVSAQAVTHYTAIKHHRDEDKAFAINWRRVATTSLFGFAFVGPVGHFWYEGLDRFIRLRLHMQPKSLRFVATKVALDGIIFGPLDLLVFFTYMGYSTGKNTTQVVEAVKRDFLPALILEGGIWPIVQVANFRYIPVRYQLLYVNFFCLLDSSFLSWIEQQEDAAWKQWLKSIVYLKEQKEQVVAMINQESGSHYDIPIVLTLEPATELSIELKAENHRLSGPPTGTKKWQCLKKAKEQLWKNMNSDQNSLKVNIIPNN